MALTLICPNTDTQPWIQALTTVDPELEIRVWPDDHPKQEIELALTWGHPPGVLKDYPNLGCISSMGAGVDHLLSDPDLPQGVPIVRLVDTLLVRDMAEYLLLAVLSHFRQFDTYESQKSRKEWYPLAPLDKLNFPVGVMGLGQLGKAAALKLNDEGFPVLGWKNSPGAVVDIKTFYGRDQLPDFVSQCRVLICLLPLTRATRHILDMKTFSMLTKGSYLINVGRGGHLKDKDLITALDRGLLAGACLDVFETEPLIQKHPFWDHPGIRITPHVSSQTRPESVVIQILENLERLRTKKNLLHPVDPGKGY